MTRDEAVRAAWKAADAADEYRAPFEAHFLAALGVNGFEVVATDEFVQARAALATARALLREAYKVVCMSRMSDGLRHRMSAEDATMNDAIKHMVNRFLAWKLPADFSPDAGISFKATFNEHTPYPMKHEPIGTNLFNAVQAEAMVRYMIEGLPVDDAALKNGGGK